MLKRDLHKLQLKMTEGIRERIAPSTGHKIEKVKYNSIWRRERALFCVLLIHLDLEICIFMLKAEKKLVVDTLWPTWSTPDI